MNLLELSPFRLTHAKRFIDFFKQQNSPLDVSLNRYYRQNRALGSKDRHIIGDLVYEYVRYQLRLEALFPRLDLEEQLQALFQNQHKKCDQMEPHIRLSFPKEVFDLLSSSYGVETAIDLCEILNTKAPTTLRTNTLKIDRLSLFEKLKERLINSKAHLSLTKFSPLGISIDKKLPLTELDLFKEGLFEFQDEASQLVSLLVDAKPHERVLDFCAGSGGKALTIATKMHNKGEIVLHDIRKTSLLNAKKRFQRAGIFNVQFATPETFKKTIRGGFDWVLTDVPCTGVGTYRRNPDGKYRLNQSILEQFVQTQRMIVNKAIECVKPGKFFVYSTCSLLQEENEQQVDYFLAHYPLELIFSPLKLLPIKEGMDGLFGAVFRVKLR